MNNEVKIKCPSSFCLRDATISKGKRRLTIKCPNCGPLNFQTRTGQESLKKYMVERGVSLGNESTDTSTENVDAQVSENATAHSGLNGTKATSENSSETTDKKPKKGGFNLWGFSV